MFPGRVERLYCRLKGFNLMLRINFGIYHVRYRENFVELVYIEALVELGV